MPNLAFPESPSLPIQEPVPVVRVVPREPLAAIREVLSISIHDVVNSAARKCMVADLYRITCGVEDEAWLRRRFREQRQEAWIAANL